MASRNVLTSSRFPNMEVIATTICISISMALGSTRELHAPSPLSAAHALLVYTYIHTHTCRYVHVLTYMCAYNIHAYAYIHTCTNNCVCTYICTNTHTQCRSILKLTTAMMSPQSFSIVEPINLATVVLYPREDTGLVSLTLNH